MRRLPDLRRLTESRRIDDRYLSGTTLRLRAVAYPSGGRPPQYKLGQKLRLDESDPARVMHTSIYLTEEEHSRLGALPGADLSKIRHTVLSAGDRFGLDVFLGRHQGLAVVEIELRGEADPVPPAFAGPEVTGDERFSGGWLAFASLAELNGLLSDSGISSDG